MSNSSRVTILQAALRHVENGDLFGAAQVLRQSSTAIDQENARNCENLAIGGSPFMVEQLKYILGQHLETERIFGGDHS